MFVGAWLIGTGFALLFARHKHSPFDAFTSKVPVAGVPLVVAACAAALAAAWAAVPRFKSELTNELIRAGVTVGGGVFAPHALSFLFGSLL